MDNIKDFVLRNKDISTFSDGNYDNWMAVVTQATRHCTRSDMTELYSISRPNEEEVFKKWRNSNKRSITVSPILSFKLLLVRVLQQTMYDISLGNIPNLNKLIYDDLLLLSLYDPNAFIVEWVYNPSNPSMPLTLPVIEGGLAQNEKLGNETIIINSEKVLTKNKDFVIWYAGDVLLGKDKQAQKFYYGLDNENYYIILPDYNEKKEIFYKIGVWYNHGLGRMPIAEVPGFKTKDNYKESICWGAYEYLDEAVIAFSSDQIARIRHALPKLVVNADLTCTTCNGSRQETLSGKQIECRTCKGSGILQDIGDFATVKIRGRNEFDRANSNPVYYVQTPANIEYMFGVWERLVQKAERQICIDLLEGTGNESGIAKELRLEPRQDMLKMYGEQFCEMMENIINNYNTILKTGEKEVKIAAPTYYATKSPEMLEYEISVSPLAERHAKYIEMIKQKYRGDNVLIARYTYATLYAPLFLYKTDEVMIALNTGAYSEMDIVRRDYALYVMQEIFTDEAALKKLSSQSKGQIFEEADKILKDMGKLKEPVPDMPTDDILAAMGGQQPNPEI